MWGGEANVKQPRNCFQLSIKRYLSCLGALTVELPERRLTLTGARVLSGNSSRRDGRGKRFRRLLRTLPAYLDQRVDQHRPNMGVEVLYGVKRWQPAVARPATAGVWHEMGAPSAAQVTCIHTPTTHTFSQYSCAIGQRHGERETDLGN